jgi:ABC-type nitrate/sulfonate/bicarbonate transport system ATPase subunit
VSGGEARQVSAVRAPAIRPFLFLLDAFLSLLDRNTRLSFQAEAARTLRARLIVSSVGSESAQFPDTL